ncbi:MAG: hypothetical protein AVDCRST_MAG91-695, partial [uncultured Sphingomonadaceae bacterium]
ASRTQTSLGRDRGEATALRLRGSSRRLHGGGVRHPGCVRDRL